MGNWVFLSSSYWFLVLPRNLRLGLGYSSIFAFLYYACLQFTEYWIFEGMHKKKKCKFWSASSDRKGKGI